VSKNIAHSEISTCTIGPTWWISVEGREAEHDEIGMRSKERKVGEVRSSRLLRRLRRGEESRRPNALTKMCPCHVHP
jgi:hypothetical protein